MPLSHPYVRVHRRSSDEYSSWLCLLRSIKYRYWDASPLFLSPVLVVVYVCLFMIKSWFGGPFKSFKCQYLFVLEYWSTYSTRAVEGF